MWKGWEIMLCLSLLQVDTCYWKLWRRNQIINPKTIDLRRMLSDPWLKRRVLRRLLEDCFRIMGPQNIGSPACGRKLRRHYNSVIHYSHKFFQLLLDSLQSCLPFGVHCTECNLTAASRVWCDYMNEITTHSMHQSTLPYQKNQMGCY